MIQRNSIPFNATIMVVAGLSPKERTMMDLLMLALTFALFAAAIGYTYACERL